MKTLFKNARVALLTFSVILALASCKKNDEVTPTGNNSPAFVDKKWKMTAFELTPAVDLDGDGTPDSDLMPYLDDCAKDDLIIFKKDGSLGGDPGAKLCPGDNTSGDVSGSWTYDKNTKMLKIIGNDGPNDLDEFEVIEASANTLKTKVQSTEEGVTITAVITWKAM